MQEDMHYYGTYAMARAAGLAVKHAKVVAYASQYVDESTAMDSEVHEDGGMFQAIATCHTDAAAIGTAMAGHTQQRQVWVPCHFFPGNEGATLSERVVCTKDSPLVREMVQNHIRHAVSVRDEYGLPLIGLMAHVYADTFSHYGFSGISSRNNKVDGTSFELAVKDPAVKAYIMGKYSAFLTKYTPSFLIDNFRNFASKGAAVATGALGHGAVGTYPDRPFLRWRFNYSQNNRNSGWRENAVTYLEACEKLHQAFNDYAVQADVCVNPVPFAGIRDAVDAILRLESAMEGRIKAWTTAIADGRLFPPAPDEALFFSKHDWEQQKRDFEDLNQSQEMIAKEVYQFAQAANYHRGYTLKQLLPKHGLAIL